MNILLTGGTGSLGRSVLELLLAGGDHEITVVHRRHVALPPSARQVCGDLADFDFLRWLFGTSRFDVVMHLAAALGDESEKPHGYLLNAVVPVWLCHQAAEHGVKRVVFASSMAVYAPFTGIHGAPEYTPITENYPQSPTRLYGVAKLSAEQAGTLLARKTGLEFIAVRFSPYYGPRKPAGGLAGLGALLSSAVMAAHKGEAFSFPNWPDACFDPIYAEDAAYALVLAAFAAKLPPEGVVHVSGQRALRCADVVDLIRRVVPSGQITLRDACESPSQGRHGWAVFDNSRARDYLGYKPRFSPEHAFKHFTDVLTGITETTT